MNTSILPNVEGVLSRSEMKNVKGGCSIETNWEGCGSAQRVIGCWHNLCMDPSIVPWNQTADCVAEVEATKLYVESTCGIIIAL